MTNWSIIVVGVILMCQTAVTAIHIIAMKLYWRYLNFGGQTKITAKYTTYTVFLMYIFNPLTAGRFDELYSRSDKLFYLAYYTLYYIETIH